MSTDQPLPRLRIFYLEDNPLIVFHVESMLEDLGYIFAGSVGSFAELKRDIESFAMDGALVDIDLADGRTGPAAAEWLHRRGIPTLFITGQELLAAEHRLVSLGVITKPVEVTELAEKLELFRRADRGPTSG